MEGFKEFQGKNLDSAIEEACGYFNAAREKLEIEILQDAKSGIFGIVGARKAKVRARRAHLRETVENILGKKSEEPAARTEEGGREKSGGRSQGRKNAPTSQGGRQSAGDNSRGPGASGAGRRSGPAAPRKDVTPPECREAVGAEKERIPADVSPEQGASQGTSESCEPQAAVSRQEVRSETRPEQRRGAGGGRGRASGEGQARARREESRKKSEAAVDGLDEDLEEAGEGLPFTPVEQLDAARLEALVNEAVRELVRPIVGAEVQLAISVGGGRVQVCVECGEDSGLLIGREGQTLAALQYLVSRVVSRGMNAAVRVQLDAGEYRQRQDEKLREMALALAEKVRQSGRSYSTRPLSSYHRRIVHVCLQDAEDVQTRSTGDGAMKRVVIMRRKA
ncbi:RNA-binding cell elongation regulator Jag/EloR [Desulfovibrio sp. ZJ369]|uniref:RNA-binding cell elongation regulator Jag/EloR n=1 Tax=Desulfovibrio sp. ZJ369 TaxID=2709793 RepID=UPI0013EADA88|nr:RNA-binding cell elongation regulator Jag/EloR [Desulfovibrio sp. ZJ369]